MSALIPEPQILSTPNAKQAVRLAETLLGEIPFRDEQRFLEVAAGRVAGVLRREGEEPVFALYRRRAGSCHIVEDRSRAGFPGLLPAQQMRDLEREASLYFDGAAPGALWSLGPRRDWVVAWRFSSPARPEDVLGLEAARLVIGQRLTESSFSDILAQAAAIQASLLPDPLPRLAGFDVAARSVAAESVGGDVYDLLDLGAGALGFAVADASGHGLPAALEARDVVVGLRMGAERHMKIGATIEKLNRILCRSTLPSRFVSLIYGELELDGGFQLINAGHPPPIVLSPGSTPELSATALVLGVSPDSRYRPQHGRIEPGGALVLVTDGVLECRSRGGEEFGAERVRFIARALSDRPARWIVEAIFEALDLHARTPTFADDATILVIRREP